MSSMFKSFAHAQKHRISTICGEDNGLCQSPSFLGQEELGSGYEIDPSHINEQYAGNNMLILTICWEETMFYNDHVLLWW